MGKPLAYLSPEQAYATLAALPGRKSLAALQRELTRTGRPVSLLTLRRWRSNGWKPKRAARKPTLMQDVRDAAERAGLNDDALGALEISLGTLSDGHLVGGNMRALLINSAILMAHATAALPELIESDPRGAAVLYAVAGRMVRGGVALLRDSRSLAERVMRERLRLPTG